MTALTDLLDAGRTTEAVTHRAAQPPRARLFRLPGGQSPAELPNGLYPHELEGRIVSLRHVTVVPITRTGTSTYNCVVVASDHDAYPVGGYLLSITVDELGSGAITDGPRPVGEAADNEYLEPTDDELLALHGPSTETLADHLGRWDINRRGLVKHLADVHGIEPPFGVRGWPAIDGLHRAAHAGDPGA